MIITIDGPVASGKSSVAKLLAEQLGFYHINTGLLYRAVAYILQNEYGMKTCEQLAAVTDEQLAFIADISYTFVEFSTKEAATNNNARVFYKNQNLTPYLKQANFDQPASVVSASAAVRQRLLGVQRVIGKTYDIVADGRDCGSIVYPDAEYKFFLTASLEVRAQRMADMLNQTTGQSQDLAAIKASVAERDKRDAERAVAPLRVPEGAILIDNAALTIAETVQVMMGYVKN